MAVLNRRIDPLLDDESTVTVLSTQNRFRSPSSVDGGQGRKRRHDGTNNWVGKDHVPQAFAQFRRVHHVP
jgi:hypothetical protein